MEKNIRFDNALDEYFYLTHVLNYFIYLRVYFIITDKCMYFVHKSFVEKSVINTIYSFCFNKIIYINSENANVELCNERMC